MNEAKEVWAVFSVWDPNPLCYEGNTEKCGKQWKTGRTAPLLFSTWGKGPSPLGQASTLCSHQRPTASCSICKQLFWIDLFHLKQNGILLLQFGLSKKLSKCRQTGAFCWFVLCCALDRHSWVILLSCGSQQNRGLQVSNDPLNASQIVNAPVPLFSLPLPSSFLLN